MKLEVWAKELRIPFLSLPVIFVPLGVMVAYFDVATINLLHSVTDKAQSTIGEECVPEISVISQKESEANQGNEPQQPFQIDFSTFIMSLTSSAFYHLGDIADPETGKTETNLPAVHQTIDMLTMLREKTKNNLTAEENKLLEQLIYELQMKYVAKTKSADKQ